MQTELHDAKHQPDLVNGESIGMPLQNFMDKAWEGLCEEGKEEIPVGTAEKPFQEGGWEVLRQVEMRQFWAAMKKSYSETEWIKAKKAAQ